MQEIKFVMRNVGVPDTEKGIVSAVDLEQHLEYNYLSNGFSINTVSVTPIAGGFTVFVVLVKEDEVAKKK